MTWQHNQLTTTFFPLNDAHISQVRENWFANSHPIVPNKEAIPLLNEWFQSTTVNDLQGWQTLSCVDITMGCAHYIESFVLRHGWDGFQILNDEYAYYSFMGKWGVNVGELEANKPLIITLPHYKWAGVRPEWDEVLKECERKNIDIHIDMAWVTLAKNVNIDFSHPCIQSVGMTMSKYSMQWNRVGLRYSKQRTMDSITMFNHYYQPDTNSALSSCAAYAANLIPRDYGWKRYGKHHLDICSKLNLVDTDLVHIVRTHDNKPMGITNMLKTIYAR